ncbi:SDR family NAD(P)-dependent oxidoreductase, partial [Dactylosporangium sp. NPDC005572]|uniref:type I polyketide synthase n=1 Tax=Dactylosporangium sp. NPDC005572 TaxID=3156889 RepID=UPI0033ACAA15
DIMWANTDNQLHQTGNTQPALFAFQVALGKLLAHHGIRPTAYIGHSIGEIAAAHLAGILSLQDAATLVTARATLMQSLPPGGAMAVVTATEAQITPLLTPGVAIAAINTPTSLVLSGDAKELNAITGNAKTLKVSHAFHSPLMDPILDQFHAIAATLTYHQPHTPLTTNGDPTTPEYWTQHLRGTVRYHDNLQQHTGAVFLELGPDTTLTTLAAEHTAIPTQNPNKTDTYTTAIARLHQHNIPINWDNLLPGGRHVTLPTYPFQRQSFWIATNGPRAAEPTGHPLVDATTELDDGGALHTGRLSARTQPWLPDHVVFDELVVPGTTWVELSSWAGRRIGCPRLAEFTHESPLILTGGRSVELQLRVGGPGDDGRREVTLRCRTAGTTQAWVSLGRGVLAPAGDAPTPDLTDLTQWPPAGASAVNTGEFYERHDALGFYRWGPRFRSLRAAWRRGDDLFAEVRFADDAATDGFDLHPALLDATLHALGLNTVDAQLTGLLDDEDADRRPKIPFTWRGVTVHRVGERSLRVRLRAVPAGTELTLADPTGAPVATVESMVILPVSARQLKESLATPRHESLYRLDWHPLPTVATPPSLRTEHPTGLTALAAGLDALEAAAPDLVIVPFHGDTDTGPVAATHNATRRLLALLRDWLARPALSGTHLAVLTRGAVAAVPGDRVTDLAAAAVAGMLRTAATEQPGRFTHLDTDDPGTPAELLESVAAGARDHAVPQVAIRGGTALAPSLARVPLVDGERPRPLLDPAGTVLVTGGTGALGRLAARHLVDAHGARKVVLVSRRGAGAGDVDRLRADLETLGAQVRVEAADVARREDVERVLAGIDDLTSVVHTAGIVEDAVLTALEPDALQRVLRPKVDGAWHLHELTAGRDLGSFVLYSAAANVLGGAGQANYAAANAFLDALAEHRRAAGLPAVSLAWGLWERDSGVTGHLTAADRQRIARMGFAAMPDEEGMALLDQAVAAGAPVLVPARMDLAALRGAETVHPLLRRLVRALPRPAAAASTVDGPSPAARLTGLPEADQQRIVMDLVVRHIATVTDQATGAVDRIRSFRDMGFDSLMALELRNRLSRDTGLDLPATLVFDHPNATDLAQQLRTMLAPAGARDNGGHQPVDDDAIRRALATITPARLREAGLLDGLMRLAGQHAVAPAPAGTPAAAATADVGAMDVDDLVRLALGTEH